jgi:uncharacterized glyoxalase superfamily protein PhnB
MDHNFPAAVPEIPVKDIDEAVAYYEDKLGFRKDWGGGQDGIAGISNGRCRLFLTDPAFREPYGNFGPVLIWLNLSSKEEVNALYARWRDAGAKIVSGPEEKPWKLHEFTVADGDGNLLRVFYDFSRDGGTAKNV